MLIIIMINYYQIIIVILVILILVNLYKRNQYNLKLSVNLNKMKINVDKIKKDKTTKQKLQDSIKKSIYISKAETENELKDIMEKKVEKKKVETNLKPLSLELYILDKKKRLELEKISKKNQLIYFSPGNEFTAQSVLNNYYTSDIIPF